MIVLLSSVVVSFGIFWVVLGKAFSTILFSVVFVYDVIVGDVTLSWSSFKIEELVKFVSVIGDVTHYVKDQNMT